MSLPIPTNTTCDIYRSGNAPPNPPDVAGVAGNLQPHGTNIKTSGTAPYTHALDVPLTTDIRSSPQDTIYVPTQSGTPFTVVWVERIRVAGGNDYKRAYLKRKAVTWPSNQL
jgi:hypothetical protein